MYYRTLTIILSATAFYLEVSRTELEHGRIRPLFTRFYPSAQPLQEERRRFLHGAVGVRVM